MNTALANPQLDQFEIKGHLTPEFETILTPEAIQFLTEMHLKFDHRRKELLKQRAERQEQIDDGVLPDFLPETAGIRQSAWKVAPLPADLMDRRVEITGPVDRKMIINAMNSGAKVFMADFEDSNTPSWENCLNGQINLHDAVKGTINFFNPKKEKYYLLNQETATLMVRPRGWHLEERHLLIEGAPISGSLFDFGLYFFHNVKSLTDNGSGPYFYLPKLESHHEARLWNEVFVFAQNYLGIPVGTIKATVLIETILAAFEMDEILYELRQHSAGLNCGRWDYIFSYIKKFRNLPGFILPDRAQVGMTTPFMSAYSKLVIETCHKRGVHAMGGMAAQIPIKNDAVANERALEKVRQDKLLEVQNGHDGTWVAHPALVPIAMDVFNQFMPAANQIDQTKAPNDFEAKDLLAVPEGTITEAGVRQNINVGILYVESWLRGNGAAAIYHLMEDAATAEISRTQLWQWLKAGAETHSGQVITKDWVESLIGEELIKIQEYVGADAYTQGKFESATELFKKLIYAEAFFDFLTLPAYSEI
ncbi:MAG: malate synthase A [Bacteroidota bacterium]